MSSPIIVGSGVAGAVLARELLESGSGHRVTVFEAGPAFKTGTYRVWLDHLMAGHDPYDGFIDDPRDEHERFGLRGSRLFVKGGTTNHWGGWSLRFKPEDFELKSRTGIGADWPIDYDELAPYYTRSEHLLGVEGDSDDDDPPRHGDRFPFEAAPYTLNDLPVIRALETLGMSYSHMPMARNGDKCVTTGTCRYCPVSARYSAAYDLALLKTEYGDRLDVRTLSPVLMVVMDGKRRARGVSFLNRETGSAETLEGDAIAITGGTVESTKLLLASAHEEWPDGVGNDSGHLGRHLVGHPLLFASGARPGNPDRAAQELGFITLASRHFDTPKFQRAGKMLIARVGDDSNTALEREILGNSPRADIEARMESSMRFGLEASVEQFESPENRIALGKDVDSRGLPTTEISFGVNETTERAMATHAENLRSVLMASGCAEESIRIERIKPDGAHATSTCRMSRSEADGVVDRNLRVHGTDNLFLCSNAVFPGVTAVNPTLTVGALAAKLGRHLDSTLS